MPFKIDTHTKLNGEQINLLLDIISLCIIHGETNVKAAERLKEETGIEITEQAVWYHRKNNRDEIASRIDKFAADLVKDCPITKKDFRLYQIQEAFLKATDVKTRLACIREARHEIDAHGDKIADAIKQSGNRVNIFDFGNMSNEERERYQKQCNAYFARFNGSGNRIHSSD